MAHDSPRESPEESFGGVGGVTPETTNGGPEPHYERPVDRIRRSAVGSVVAAGLLGLRDALEGRPEKEEVAITSNAPERVGERDLELTIDLEHPERSVAIVRSPPRDG